MPKDAGYWEKMRDYKNGVWSFMLEHCQILPSGKMRVIFDTNSQDDFEKRVWARYKNVYHRGDPAARQKFIDRKQAVFSEEKRLKKEKYTADKKQRKDAQAEIKKAVENVGKLNKKLLDKPKKVYKKNWLRKIVRKLFK